MLEKIRIKDFCGHCDTEISFNDFQSALIIGKSKGNDRFSNGTGKSTIFNAIGYLFYNEIHFSSLEKIIRDGCNIATVEGEFISSLDNCLYKIVRSNSRKTGTDVRLFKKNKDNWEDLTQRRVSDTEKEIVKLIGFNYKTFCASVLFNQSGSENNVQRDFGNLASLTPEKRKSVLREVLQLNIYTNYEKLAKAKLAAIQSSLEKEKIILSTIGDPNVKILELDKQLEITHQYISEVNPKLNTIKEKLNAIKSEFSIINSKLLNNKNKSKEVKCKIEDCNTNIIKSNNTIKELKYKISKLLDEAKNIQNQIKQIEEDISKIDLKNTDITVLKEKLNNLTQQIINIKTNINTEKTHLQELNKPIAEQDICDGCHQLISEEHRHNWKLSVEQKSSFINNRISSLEKEYEICLTNKLNIEKQISYITEQEKLLSKFKTQSERLSLELDNKRNLYSNYSSLIEEHNNLLNSKNIELTQLQELQRTIDVENDTSAVAQIEALRVEIVAFQKEEELLNKKINSLLTEKAIIEHKIENAKNEQSKILNINHKIEELEKSVILHSKVVQAFGSNGIPALITNNILDELQEEANIWLNKLRPGLSLRFIVINDKNNKEKEDTLEISYIIDGFEREYKQLSGAQKITVALAIKLGLSSVMKKRLDIRVNLLLLDEVDQALDDGSIEIFADIIKIIQNETKVMVITHNDDLKHKFSHAILVEQDENNCSTGTLINW